MSYVQHEISHEGETGKVFRANFHDRYGRTVLIMRPGMQVWTIFLLLFLSLFPLTSEGYEKSSILNEYLLCYTWQNTSCAEDNIRHLVYLIENSILNLAEGQEQMAWLIDFTGLSLSNSISVRTARDIINILQNHYPERLAIAFLYNPPRIFEAFYKVWWSCPFCSFWSMILAECLLIFRQLIEWLLCLYRCVR